MSDARTRVLVVGAGPAGLAAAARLLEEAGDHVRVRLATLGHHLGGKASSWRDSEGRIIDHGQHVVLGWYWELKALLRRAGVDVEARLVSNEGHTYVHEPRDGGLHDLALKRNPLHVLFRTATYSGFTPEETANVTGFILRNLGTFFGAQDLEAYDDVCFSAWCLENGLSPSIVQTEAFHISRDAQLNWPGEISAYVQLKELQEVARDYRTSEYGFPDGGMSERFWKPILSYIAEMGGEYEMMRQLVGLRHEGSRITAALFAEPDAAGHDEEGRDPGRSRYEDTVPEKQGTQTADEDFDFL